MPKLDRDLDYILAKALRKEPEDRYRTVDEFGADLQAVIETRSISARRREWIYLIRKYWFIGPGLFGFVGSLVTAIASIRFGAVRPVFVIGLMGGGCALGVVVSVILRIHRKGAFK